MNLLNDTNEEDDESQNSPENSSHDPVDSNDVMTHGTLACVSHDHCYAINGCCVGSEYNWTAEQRSLLDTMTASSSSHNKLTTITANDHTIKLVATTTQEDQGYDTMSSSGSPVGSQDTAATPLSILEEKIKVNCDYLV